MTMKPYCLLNVPGYFVLAGGVGFVECKATEIYDQVYFVARLYKPCVFEVNGNDRVFFSHKLECVKFFDEWQTDYSWEDFIEDCGYGELCYVDGKPDFEVNFDAACCECVANNPDMMKLFDLL